VAGLGARLDAGEVHRLRLRLSALYRRVFGQVDPGLPHPAPGVLDRLSLEQRFVTPDVYERKVEAPQSLQGTSRSVSVHEPRVTSVYCPRFVYEGCPLPLRWPAAINLTPVAAGDSSLPARPCRAGEEEFDNALFGVEGPAVRRKRPGRDLAGIPLLVSGFQAANINGRRTPAASPAYTGRGTPLDRPRGGSS
jgi:hypothetical protein